MSVPDRKDDTIDPEKQATVPDNHTAIQSDDHPNRMMVYEEYGDEAWIRGQTIDPTKVRR